MRTFPEQRRGAAAHALYGQDTSAKEINIKLIILTISLLLLVCTGIQSSPKDQTANARGLPIIDMHMHATPLEAFPPEWGRPPLNPITGKPSAATNNEAIMTASLRAMTRFNIVKAVVSGPLEDVHRWQAAAPGRIIGGIWGATGRRVS